jgi:hypothetical protein
MQDLIDMMKSAGVSEDVAERRASEYLRDQEDETRFEKALSALDGVAEAQREAEEAQYERMSKAFSDGQETVAEALAPALDALLTEQRAQNEALCKGLQGALELIKSLQTEVKGLRGVQTAAEPEPMAKSVSYIPAPGEATAADTSRDDLFKALSTMTVNEPARAAEMMEAAALLESGADPSSIKSRFGI